MRAQFLLPLTLTVLSSNVVMAQDASDESEAIEIIELLGAKVERDDKLPDRPVVGVSFNGSRRFNDEYVHLLKAFQNLAKLDLSDTKITDVGLKRVPELKSLVELSLFETSVTPTGLAELRESSPGLLIVAESAIKDLNGEIGRAEKPAGGPITSVSFAGSRKFNDKSVRLLKPLKSLMTLQLQNTRITDDGLKELKNLENLRALLLFGNQITDEGLKELKEFKKLTSLWLGDTKITDIGLTELLELKT